MHVQVEEWIRSHLPPTDPAAVLELGSLDVNGGLRQLFGPRVRFHGVDRVAGPGVDEVADAADPRFPGGHDLVLCTEVLEHAPRWTCVLENAWDALEPGGRLLMTCATDPRAPHSAVDGMDVRPDEYYRNVSPAELTTVVRGWTPSTTVVEVHLGRGDLYVLADKEPVPT